MTTGTAMSLGAGIAAVRRRASGMRHPLVLVDGPSGAGKTTFTHELLAAWPGSRPQLVRVDATIPGWRGLHRGAARLDRSLVMPRGRGAVGVVPRWDWSSDRPGPDERVPPGGALIVEGCGAFRAGASSPHAIRVWVDAPYAQRRRRALDRDHGAFDPFWDAWEADWRRHVLAVGPGAGTALRVRLGGNRRAPG